MARKRDRLFAGFFAVLFLVTSSALTIGVIWQATHTQNQSEAQQAKANQAARQTKLPNFTPAAQPQAQLQTIDTKVGTGDAVKPGDTITVDYTGALMSNGVVFDASSMHGGASTLSLKDGIAGWSQGIPGMKVGGTRRLLIPAALAYGPQSQADIPANSDLVFDVTLRKIDK